MNLAVVLAIAVSAPGCQLVFPLDNPPDRFPHVPADREGEPNEVDLVVSQFIQINTNDLSVLGDFGAAELETMRQDGADSDLVVLRVGTLRVLQGGHLQGVGAHPLVIIARTIEIATGGKIDASAQKGDRVTSPGPGGGRPDDTGGPGVGASGALTQLVRSATGGGGGGHATPGGEGGLLDCLNGLEGGAGGEPVGDDRLTLLIGGGAGGPGGVRCDVAAPGGAGGGAIQLSATESISIGINAAVFAGGAGGLGGAGVDACALTDGGGGGGGAGGAIYLDAPVITNEGLIAAQGGGGGGGGGDGADGNGTGVNGEDGHAGNALGVEGEGGIGTPNKGTFGGDGGRGEDLPQNGATGKCSVVTPGRETFNTGGGGGAVGRIVIRGNLATFGMFSPPPAQLAHPVP